MKFKLSKEETVELGMELYLKGWNCGEATSTAFIRALGYETDLFPRAGTSLGSGFGGEHRYQCGALSSAVLASGAAFGRDDPDGDRSPSNNLATQFIKDFEEKFGAFNCCELVGLDQDQVIPGIYPMKRRINVKKSASIWCDTHSSIGINLAEDSSKSKDL